MTTLRIFFLLASTGRTAPSVNIPLGSHDAILCLELPFIGLNAYQTFCGVRMLLGVNFLQLLREPQPVIYYYPY
jgi:hypothetical protein